MSDTMSDPISYETWGQYEKLAHEIWNLSTESGEWPEYRDIVATSIRALVDKNVNETLGLIRVKMESERSMAPICSDWNMGFGTGVGCCMEIVDKSRR